MFWHHLKLSTLHSCCSSQYKKRGKIQGPFRQCHEYVTLNLFHFEKKKHNDKSNGRVMM